MAQPVRRSQFITTYGPGAILEGPDGPRVIRTLDSSGIFAGRRTSDFEITDQRLSQALLGGHGILRLPSNAEVGESDYRAIYDTNPFPSWSLCVTHGVLYHKTSSDNRACPRCPARASKGDASQQARREAIRFVRACQSGHMDDVDWMHMIRHRNTPCSPVYLHWRGGGGALRDVNVVCPDCGGQVNLGYAYSADWPCSGRQPEQGNFRPGCDQPSKIVQRGAANLRMPEIRTALTIPPRYTRLHRLFEMSVVQTMLVAARPQSKHDLVLSLEDLASRGLLNQSLVEEIQGYPEENILEAVSDVLTGGTASNDHELRLEEFKALSEAATQGAPPQQSSAPGSPPQFEVVQQHVRVLDRAAGYGLRVTPASRLRVVMVQTGYRRLGPLNSLVDLPFDDGQRPWYPGVELFGEGIFIDLDPSVASSASSRIPTGSAAHAWLDSWRNPSPVHLQARPDSGHELHPTFVWWHTFAHRLMNGMAIDSGYSAASLRERVFVEIDEQSGEASGGVLLYTAQPGGDGTLGGLIALVPQFERVLEAATRDLDACSNDPLCSEEAFGPAKHNGSACYSCALVSETSCEHRNMSLDRKLLLDNPP